MPWDGSGNFSRNHNWTEDALNDINILADRHDEEDDNFSGGIDNCLTKDGQNAPEQDLPMATNKHTNVGDADGRDQYLPVGQYQDGFAIYAGVSDGTATAYTAALSPVISTLVEGMRLMFRAHVDCEAGATFNLNTIGDIPLLVAGQPVVAGDIKEDLIYAVIYNATPTPSWAVHGSSVATFLGLADTPNDYAGHVGESPVVNGTEDGLIFPGPIPGAKISMIEGTDTFDVTGVANAVIPMTRTDWESYPFHDTDVSKLIVPTGLEGLYNVSFMLQFEIVSGSNILVYLAKNGALNTPLHVPARAEFPTADLASLGWNGQLVLDEGDEVQLVIRENLAADRVRDEYYAGFGGELSMVWFAAKPV